MAARSRQRRPYLCCVAIGCWTSAPLNQHFGRRGTIFISFIVSVLSPVWQPLTNSWWHLFIARFFMGFAIGAGPSTTPLYGGLRGRMCARDYSWKSCYDVTDVDCIWNQMWIFGICFIRRIPVESYRQSADVSQMNVGPQEPPFIDWRLVLASAGIP